MAKRKKDETQVQIEKWTLLFQLDQQRVTIASGHDYIAHFSRTQGRDGDSAGIALMIVIGLGLWTFGQIYVILKIGSKYYCQKNFCKMRCEKKSHRP